MPSAPVDDKRQGTRPSVETGLPAPVTPAYLAVLRERGVRLFQENRADYSSDSAAYRSIAPKLGCSPDSLRVWCQQAERDAGQRAGLTTEEKDRLKELERESREL